jgi:hypothetical protein
MPTDRRRVRQLIAEKNEGAKPMLSPFIQNSKFKIYLVIALTASKPAGSHLGSPGAFATSYTV